MSTIEFRCIAYDTLSLPEGKIEGSRELFKGNSGMISKDVVNQKKESQVVSWMLKNGQVRNLMFSELGMDVKANYRTEIADPFISSPNAKPGDIDLIIWETEKPHQAIAVQCKRVKVTAKNTESDKVNKLTEFRGSVVQTNEMYKRFCFFRTYLMLLIVVDGRVRSGCNIFNCGSSDGTFKTIYHAPDKMNLTNGVGIVYVEIVQTSDASIDTSGMICIGIERRALERKQPIGITNRVSSLTI